MENSQPNQGLPGRKITFAASALDRGLVVGPFLAIVGLFATETWWGAVGAYYWLFCYVYYAPWLAHVVRGRTPAQDHHLAAALLGWAGMPWGAFILWPDVMTRPDVMRWAVLAAMVPGAAALLATNFKWTPRPSIPRSLLLIGGGGAYLSWVPAYLWLAAQVMRPQGAPPLLGLDAGLFLLTAAIFLPAPFIAVWIAVRLILAPLEDPDLRARAGVAREDDT